MAKASKPTKTGTEAAVFPAGRARRLAGRRKKILGAGLSAGAFCIGWCGNICAAETKAHCAGAAAILQRYAVFSLFDLSGFDRSRRHAPPTFQPQKQNLSKSRTLLKSSPKGCAKFAQRGFKSTNFLWTWAETGDFGRLLLPVEYLLYNPVFYWDVENPVEKVENAVEKWGVFHISC